MNTIKQLGIFALGYALILSISACQVRSQKGEQTNLSSPAESAEFTMTSSAQLEILEQDFWVTQLMGKDINPADSSECPSMRINLKEQSVGGSTGCNSYMGQVEIAGVDSIRFGEIISTLRACHDGNPEGEFLQALNAVRCYKVVQGSTEIVDLLSQEGKPLIRLQSKPH